MKCRLCGGDATHVMSYDLGCIEPYWRKHNVPTIIELRRCCTHGSYFTADPPLPEILIAAYQQGRTEDYYSEDTRDPKARAQRCVTLTERFLPAGARVMDVGGGDGAYAIAASQAGFDAWMHEVGTVSNERLQREGVHLVQALSEDLTVQFDAVTLWDVFEHVWPHDTFLASIHRLLKPGGQLLMEIPSPSHLIIPFLLLGRLSRSPRKEWAYTHICSYTHLQLMTGSEVRATIPRYGFQVMHAETFSALSYAGYEYAQHFIKVQPLAHLIGAVFDQPKLRAVLLGHNKTFIVAQRLETPISN
jgi:2-polyprenyl-3-methyl-5-hydroxy-6-metoxy-1,4-benzoquinol methylase